MWLITPIGFFSIVEKPSDKAGQTLTIRARVREDLQMLQRTCLPSLGPILDQVGTDYPFRATAPKRDVSEAIAQLVSAVNYPNFKNEVAKKQGHKRAEAYHDVWADLAKLE
jgi:hypothetical protein